MSTAVHSQIELDEQGTAWITGTRIKVIEVVLDKLTHGSSPEEIHFQHPPLSLSQIHAALAYYYDHQTELDEQIQSRWQEASNLARESDSPLQKRLRQLKHCK